MVYINEHKLADEALAQLRAESRRNARRPYRAKSLAEAEAKTPSIEPGSVSAGVIRAEALTGGAGAMSQPRRTPD